MHRVGVMATVDTDTARTKQDVSWIKAEFAELRAWFRKWIAIFLFIQIIAIVALIKFLP